MAWITSGLNVFFCCAGLTAIGVWYVRRCIGEWKEAREMERTVSEAQENMA